MTNLAATGAGRGRAEAWLCIIAPSIGGRSHPANPVLVGAGTSNAQGLVESRGDVSQGALQTGIGGAAGPAGGALVEKVVTPAAHAVSDRVAGVDAAVPGPARYGGSRERFTLTAQDTAAVRQFLRRTRKPSWRMPVGQMSAASMRAALEPVAFEGRGAISRTLDDRAARERVACVRLLRPLAAGGPLCRAAAGRHSSLQPITRPASTRKPIARRRASMTPRIGAVRRYGCRAKSNPGSDGHGSRRACGAHRSRRTTRPVTLPSARTQTA